MPHAAPRRLVSILCAPRCAFVCAPLTPGSAPRLRTLIGAVIGTAFGVLLAPAALAQPATNPDRAEPATDHRVRYDGVGVVQITPTTQAQHDAALSLATTLWSERSGLGPFEIALPLDRVAALDALGVNPVVVLDSVQTLIDAEWDANRSAALDAARAEHPRGDPETGGGGFDPYHRSYHDFAEIESKLHALALEHPDLASVETFGHSLESRSLNAIRITGPGDATHRPRIVWNGGQHAREWIGPAVVMFLAEQLLSGYDTDPEIRAFVDAVEFVLVPLVNPDGYHYTWTTERLWRKNRRGDHGVDLNRNWSVGWGGPGSASNPTSDTYRGTEAFSEPETAAMRDLLLSTPNLIGYIDFHSYSQLILRPRGYTLAPPAPAIEAFHAGLGDAMHDLIEDASGRSYISQPAWELYLAAGNACDFGHEGAGAIAYTIELRPVNGGFILSPDQIIPCGQEILAAMREFVHRVASPFALTLETRIPQTIPANQPFELVANAFPLTQTVADGGPVLRYRTGSSGPFASTPMTETEPDRYRAELPPIGCGERYEFYLEALSSLGVLVTVPELGADAPLSADTLIIETQAIDHAETADGWTVGLPTDTAPRGLWSLSQPPGNEYEPQTDASDPGTLCWMTDGRVGVAPVNYDLDLGFTTLTSPRYDAQPPLDRDGSTRLTYHRWFFRGGQQFGTPDSLRVQVSNNDGATWTTLETVTTPETEWIIADFILDGILTPTDRMRLRFIANDAGPDSLVEAAVDEIRFTFETCDPRTTDWNGDGATDVFDLIAYLADFSAHQPAADLDDSGVVDIFDLIEFLTRYSAAG